MGARHRDCDGGLGPRRGGWLQMLRASKTMLGEQVRHVSSLSQTCIVVTKDSFIRRLHHRTANFGDNILIRLWIFAENGTPSGFHTTVATALTNLPLVSAEALEQCLVVARRNHGRRGFQDAKPTIHKSKNSCPSKSANYIEKSCGIGNQISWNAYWNNLQNEKFCGQWTMELVVGCQNNRSHLNLLICWNNCLEEILAGQWFNLV